MADTYLTWWTSIEVDLRKSLLVGARQDTERLHDLLRTAFEAGQSSATPPSPSTAPEVDEALRLLNEAIPFRLDRIAKAECVDASVAAIRNALPAIRAALASRPAEVDDEGLPDLPDPAGTIPMYADDAEGTQTHEVDGYTAEQYRQGQRDAVAADRARRERGGA